MENLTEILDLGVDQATDTLHRLISLNLDIHCPIKTKHVSPKDKIKPWITSEIKTKIKEKQYYFQLSKLDSYFKPVYNRKRNEITAIIRQSKIDFHSRIFNQCKSNIKKTWKTINGVLGKSRSNSKIDAILGDDIRYENTKDICRVFNDHFASIAEKIDQQIPLPGPGCPNYLDYLNDFEGRQTFHFTPVSPFDIDRIINSFENKNCHTSNYSIRVLKAISPLISPILCHIVNKSLEQGIFPNFCKTARVIPIFKSGSNTELGNYRPISILPHFSKIIERVVHRQLIDHLNFNNFLTDNQYGFRQNRSTTDAIIDLTQYIFDNLDLGETVISFFLDFSKAFDCVIHSILLRKLEAYGVSGNELGVFRSYLTGRSQYVSLDGINSDTKPINRGVPQGSVLGPLLFLVYINDFPKCSKFFKFTIFADDSTLTSKFTNISEENIALKLEHELKKVDEWLLVNRLKLNTNKSHFITFSYRKNTSIRPINVGNNFIKEVNTTTFLGIILDKKLSFRDHISHLVSKCSKTVGILFKLKDFLPNQVLKILYNSMILPYLNYGIEAWHGSTQTETSKIFIMQKKAIRAVNSLPFNAHTNDYFKKDKLLKVKDIYSTNLCSTVYKYFQSPEHYPLSNRFQLQNSIHTHNTRLNNNVLAPRLNLTKSQSCFLYKAIQEWNTIPDQIKTCNNIRLFKSHLRDYYCGLY